MTADLAIMQGQLAHIGHYLLAALTLVVAVVASGHAILYKRDSRATVLWVGFIWLAPLMGGVLYFIFGVNRIRRRAVSLRTGSSPRQLPPRSLKMLPDGLRESLGANSTHLMMLGRLVNGVVNVPVTAGNFVEPLLNGDRAFPEMIRAIDAAESSVTLSTYIFDRGRAGSQFVNTLAAAVTRGVDVRVLIDDTGARYSLPTIIPLLKDAGVRVARFLPTRMPFRVMAINLRTHRKILVVDGKTAFTGGMNIRDGHLLARLPRRPVQDMHFKIKGPVVSQLQEVFADDWYFTTREDLSGSKWFPSLLSEGDVFARAIPDGPDLNYEKLRWTILGALSCAKDSVHIVTPYFLPDQALISALNVAAMRGVEVNIILPVKSNLPFVQWATFAILWQMLQRGCRIWLTAPPFDHSKLMIVDEQWTLLGSANWDPRSLRLNFELNVECYSRELAAQLMRIVDEKLRGAEQLTLEKVDSRALLVKLRDGVARLFTPFL